MARRTVAALTAESGIHAVPTPERPRRAPRAPRAPRDLQTMGVVEQVRTALKPCNRLAFGLGAALGSFVPVASYWLAHHEVDRSADLWAQLPAWLVLGGLVFSASTVYAWGRKLFGSGAKALGFCVLMEGVLLDSTTTGLAIGALVYLIGINAIATGTRLALDR
jgi:hypothetical protein